MGAFFFSIKIGFCLPLTYTYNEVSGQIDGFGIKLEPEVKPIRFIKTNGEDGEN